MLSGLGICTVQAYSSPMGQVLWEDVSPVRNRVLQLRILCCGVGRYRVSHKRH